MEDDCRTHSDKSFLEGYKSILTLKTTEETMVNFAAWEPCHGRFKFKHPWKEYIKIGTLSRQCAYKFDTIYSYLKSDIQTPAEIKIQIREPCTIICSESGKLLKELARTMRKGNQYSISSSSGLALLKTAVENLKSLLKRQNWREEVVILEIIPAVAVASQLIEIVTCVEKIAMAVQEVTSLSDFQGRETTREEPRNMFPDATVVPVSAGSNHVIVINDGSSTCFAGNENKPLE